MFKLLMGATALFISGCATTGTTSAPSTPPRYELMLSGTIDDADFSQIGVGSASKSHKITIKSDVPVNYFEMESCHRALQFPDVIPDTIIGEVLHALGFKWAPDSKSFTFNYDEAPTIEDSGNCLLRFCSFTKTAGNAPVSCAVIDFKADKFVLPSTNICNGAAGSAGGTSICHTQVGLIERIQFKGPVITAPQQTDPSVATGPYWIKDQCMGTFVDDAHTLFEYRMPEAECSIVFMEVAKPHRLAKHTVIPYDLPQYSQGAK